MASDNNEEKKYDAYFLISFMHVESVTSVSP